MPGKFCVIDILANRKTLLIENTVSGLCSQTYLNDIKLTNGSVPSLPEVAYKRRETDIYTKEMPLILFPKVGTQIMANFLKKQILARLLSRSTGLRRPNPKSLNDYFET